MNSTLRGSVSYELCWYSVTTSKLVGVEPVEGLNARKVRSWFHLQPTDAPFGCFPVTASQRRKLVKLVKHKIDLNKYDYFIEDFHETLPAGH
jgi:hypothetical protein